MKLLPAAAAGMVIVQIPVNVKFCTLPFARVSVIAVLVLAVYVSSV
jgi:hypothetical protein